MEEDKWIVQKAGQWSGPFSETQIRGYVEKGVLDGTELVRNRAGKPLPIHEAFPPTTSTDAKSPPQVDQSGTRKTFPIFSAIWDSIKPLSEAEADALKRDIERDARTPPASVSDGYGMLEFIAACYLFVGVLGLLVGGFLLVGGIGNGKVDLAVAGGAVLGSSLTCFGMGFFFNLVIDLARNSHRQTIALEKLAGITPPAQKKSPATGDPTPSSGSTTIYGD